MNVVNPTDTTHIIEVIPRYYPLDALTVSLFNEGTQVTAEVDNIYIVTNGKISITFDFEFIENSKYQIKVIDDTKTVYRGKIVATTQVPQEFNATEGLYYYE